MEQRLHPERILSRAGSLRWDAGPDFHDELVESIYTDAARIADRAVTREGERGRFDLDRTIDRFVTSRWLGFPLMLLMLTVVFWLTIEGANYPSAMLATLLVDTIHPALKGGPPPSACGRGSTVCSSTASTWPWPG